MVQWSRLCASNAGHTGLILGQRNKIPHVTWQKGKKKKKKNYVSASKVGIGSYPLPNNSE